MHNTSRRLSRVPTSAMTVRARLSSAVQRSIAQSSAPAVTAMLASHPRLPNSSAVAGTILQSTCALASSLACCCTRSQSVPIQSVNIDKCIARTQAFDRASPHASVARGRSAVTAIPRKSRRSSSGNDNALRSRCSMGNNSLPSTSKLLFTHSARCSHKIASSGAACSLP